MTILLIEQNANMALKVAHQAYVLETGKITMSGTGQELLENPDIKAAYLGKKPLRYEKETRGVRMEKEIRNKCSSRQYLPAVFVFSSISLRK